MDQNGTKSLGTAAPLNTTHISHEHPRNENSRSVAAGAAPTDYQLTLLKFIQATSENPSRVRRLVYELARTTLRRQIWATQPGLSGRETEECMLALETAISRVEEDSSRVEIADASFPRLETNAMLLPVTNSNEAATSNSLPNPIIVSSRDGVAFEPEPSVPMLVEPEAGRAQAPATEIVYPDSGYSRIARMQRRAWLWFILWPAIQLTGLAVLILVLYMGINGRFGIEPTAKNQAIDQEALRQALLEKARVPSSGLPLPSNYGVYAVSDKRLIELEPLPIRAPDVRVQLSAEITKASSVTLPDGKIVFVAFRRDLVNSAPQKGTVRVIARVVRALTLSSGKAVASQIDGSWRMRNNSYGYKVAPLAENREMIALRPETPDFTLPAGRYGLVLGALAYDFSVDGQITAPEQCLESFEAVNGLIFNECRTK